MVYCAKEVRNILCFLRSVVSYRVTELPIFNQDQIAKSEKINLYDSIDDDVLRSYNEFALASLVYFSMKEGACSEQSSRMTAMDAASKNAGEIFICAGLSFQCRVHDDFPPYQHIFLPASLFCLVVTSVFFLRTLNQSFRSFKWF